MSILLAIFDFIPVTLFIVSAVILQRTLYERLSKGAFALFSAGTIMISVAGIFKATWKFLNALNICNFERLNQAFFPMQSTGFLLAGAGMIGVTFFRRNNSDNRLNISLYPLLLAAPAVFSGTMIFVVFDVLGNLFICIGLSSEAKKRRKAAAVPLFVVSFFLLLTMGYLSSKNFEKASVNWIAEGINFVAQIIFLWGSLMIASARKKN